MGYDTLILSGGSVKGCALLGSFKYLIDHEKINIKKLKHIISASVGSLMALPLILNVSIHAFYKIIKDLIYHRHNKLNHSNVLLSLQF